MIIAKRVLTSVELANCWSHCAVRSFQGMPHLVSSTGRIAYPEATKQPLNGDWLVASKSLMVLNGHFVRKNEGKLVRAGLRIMRQKVEIIC